MTTSLLTQVFLQISKLGRQISIPSLELITMVINKPNKMSQVLGSYKRALKPMNIETPSTGSRLEFGFHAKSC